MRKKAASAEVLSIGTELIRGDHLDSNSPFLSRALSKIGISTKQFTVVPDFPLSSLIRTIRKIWKRSDLLFVCGGLGPTDDDVTRQAIAEAVGRDLVFYPDLLGIIRRRFKKRGVPMPDLNRRQAYLPRGARAIPNPVGSAPGILFEKNRKILVSLPGVPIELKAMFEKSVFPYLRRRFGTRSASLSVTLRTAGVAESRVNELIQDIVAKEKKVSFGFYAHPGLVEVKLTVPPTPEGKKHLVRVEHLVCGRFGSSLFGKGDDRLEEVIFKLLEKKNKTVSVGESCTGGFLSSHLTSIPGSSRHFKMGVVAYHNKIKSSILKVPPKLIRSRGAVSEEVARSLAQQARRLGKTDYGLGVTGILGPGGGTKTKPVGLIYAAVASPKGVTSRQFNFLGEREIMRIRVVRATLDLLRRELLK